MSPGSFFFWIDMLDNIDDEVKFLKHIFSLPSPEPIGLTGYSENAIFVAEDGHTFGMDIPKILSEIRVPIKIPYVARLHNPARMQPLRPYAVFTLSSIQDGKAIYRFKRKSL
jgi:hypothetical protein